MARKTFQKTTVDTNAQKIAAIKQEINNTLAYVGDKHFIVRQIESEITGFYGKIDQLRNELAALGALNGSQNSN